MTLDYTHKKCTHKQTKKDIKNRAEGWVQGIHTEKKNRTRKRIQRTCIEVYVHAQWGHAGVIRVEKMASMRTRQRFCDKTSSQMIRKEKKNRVEEICNITDTDERKLPWKPKMTYRKLPI